MPANSKTVSKKKTASKKKAVSKKTASKKTASKKTASKTKPRLLSGGNPQIPKGDGDAPVQAYISAAPGWKGEVCAWLDALIVKTVPGVQKAVKWNTPFYGAPGGGWFLGFHCLTKYIKISFFRGASLDPIPPVSSTQAGVRYVHLFEEPTADRKQLAAWIRQAAKLPGWMP